MSLETGAFVGLKHVIGEAVIRGDIEVGLHVRLRHIGVATVAWAGRLRATPVQVVIVPHVLKVAVKVARVAGIVYGPRGEADGSDAFGLTSVLDVDTRLERVLDSAGGSCAFASRAEQIAGRAIFLKHYYDVLKSR